MRRALTALVVSALLGLPGAASAQTHQPLAAQLQPPLPSPVAMGDWPDPDLSLIDGSYYAVATGGSWSPTFRILQSTDLRSWSIGGSVFRRPPGWAKDSFWAPELAALLSGGYALFYSAMPKRAWRTRVDGTTVVDRGRRARPWYCLGVATAPAPLGPWRDLGRPLRCTPHGAIDPTPVLDGKALYLVYKEDGNAFGEPTPLLLQRLRADGRRLLGKPRELLRNRPGTWERNVIEAPFLVRREGWWHMLYSGALCCSRRCSYAVGAARARTLAGPWRRYPGNPILRSGNGWRCPGHVSVAGDHVAFHAYRGGTGMLAGRQMHMAPLAWLPGGWPKIGDGRPLSPAAGALPASFDDPFAGASLDPEWEWPVARAPRPRVAHGLSLAAPRKAGPRLDAGVLSRRLGSDRFTATAIVGRATLTGAEAAGLAVIRGGPFHVGGQAIGVFVRGGELGIWRRGRGGYVVLARRGRATGQAVHLRIVASGRRYAFSHSGDGVRWTPVYATRRGPVEETARLALTSGGRAGADVGFDRATSTER